ncbi:AAA family ATPase [Sporocytophaga myxococcoides]|uniref:AAA family ATPase n=1 Tax=Sporocytophaga myxococcoides TaxID=153721 RepID=UPI0004293383|nr:AAA family ATPase [Sporocytophaga myxococcoides]
MSDDIIASLREALNFSPENLPLRIYLAESLLKLNNFDEAEKEFKLVLNRASDNAKAKIGLAKIYLSQGNFSTGIVVLEDLVHSENADSESLLLFAKLLLKENSIEEAMKYYKRVLEVNPALLDEELDSLRNPNHYFASEEDDFVAEVERNSMPVERPKITFEDVGGMDHVKEEIKIKIIHPMQHPELYKAYGKKIGGGILLYGPPGCGKTHLARATAGQVDAKFISVGINDILDMWIGGSEKNLHHLFEMARQNVPCVLFFDEVDALGASRSDMKQSSGRHLINQFLSELDGIESSNEGLLVLAATNAPWHLDSAFRRPGRFDRIIFVQPPDEEGRNGILKVLLKDKPLKDIDYNKIAKETKDFSGADLQALVDFTIEEKLRESFKTGIPEPIETKDLLKALKKVIPSTKEWFTTARNYALYSNESGLYDDILKYLNIKK